MKYHRRKFTSKFKSKVVLEAIAKRETLSEIAMKFDLERKQITGWEKKFVANAHMIFELKDFPKRGKKVSVSKNNKKVLKESVIIPFDAVVT